MAPSGRPRDDRAKTSPTWRRALAFRWPCVAPTCRQPIRRHRGHGLGSAPRRLPPAGRRGMEASPKSVTVDGVSHCGISITSEPLSPESGQNANTELLVPRSMPILNLGCASCAIGCPCLAIVEIGRLVGHTALFSGYSVLTWNSTFQRRSDLVCFIQSSRFPSSVTTALICTGTG